MIGQTISHYKILEKLGEGGMGVVYKAEDIRLGRIVALKFPPSDRLENVQDVERFNREARAVSALNNPHITTIYELGEADGRKFIVLEYVPGGTLKTYAKDVHESGRNLSVEQVVDFSIQIIRGLAHAHDNGVIHRDLKPDNLLLTDKGQVKITDFGLAKLKGASQLTKSGSTLGTISYMSPEQVRGEESDARSDLFSFGVILYQLATGQLPFRGEHEAAISYSIVNEDPVPPKTLRPEMSDELAGVITRCLEKDKGQRFGSAKELSDELIALLPKEATGKKTASPGSRRTRWTLFSIITAIAIAAIAVILLVTQQPEAPAGQTWVAVLPFENLSAESENEYFSDGITEDIITQLSKIGDLSVISRTSTMRYKNTDKSLREIGEELRVDAILEGSVRLAGKQVRITGQLIDARSDEHLWAETYDRELTDIFKIQSDVAEKIASALEARLTREEKNRIKAEPTQNMAAYDAYLRGREYYYRYRKADNEDAIVLFKRALEIDSDYALAYAGLADAYAQRVTRFAYSEMWLDSAYVAAQNAIELNPELAEAHKALGLVYQIKGQCRKALGEIEKALEYNPNFEPAVGNRGWNLIYLGRPDEAIPWLNKAMRLGKGGDLGATHLGGLGLAYLLLDDLETARRYFESVCEIMPSDVVANVGLMWLALMEGHYEQVKNRIKRFMMFAPDHPFLLQFLGIIEILEGNFVDARTHLEKAVELHKDSHSPFGTFGGPHECQINLAYAQIQMGEIETANILLDEASNSLKNEIKNGNEGSYILYLLAEADCIQGNRSGALQWFQKALNSGFVFLRLVEVNPLLDEIRDDPQFKKMTADFKARITKMRERVENNDR